MQTKVTVKISGQESKQFGPTDELGHVLFDTATRVITILARVVDHGDLQTVDFNEYGGLPGATVKLFNRNYFCQITRKIWIIPIFKSQMIT